MPTYEITSPTGEAFEITAPEGATEAEVMSYAQSQWKGQPVPQTPVQQQAPAQPSYLDPNIAKRGTFLPLGMTAEGGYEPAMPQAVIDILESAKLPGRAYGGEPITEREVTQMGLNIGVPALRGIGGTAMRQVPGKLTRKLVKEAPTTEQLRTRGGALFERAKGATATISPESYQGVLAKMETDIFKKGFDPGLHPRVAAAMNAIGKRLGTEMDMQDMQNVRRLISSASENAGKDERRIVTRMISQIDEYIDTLGTKDLLGGDVGDAAANLRAARKLWSQMSKSEMIDDIFVKAQAQASGFENGLRVGFRSLLKDKKRLRGFSADEIAAMKEVVEGTFTRNTLKRLGKLGPGSGQQTNVLGAMGGAGGGALVGGPVGMVGVPATGWAAQKGGEALTKQAAERARALAAGARAPSRAVPYSTQAVPRTALGQGLAAQPQPKGPLSEDLLKQFWARGGV